MPKRASVHDSPATRQRVGLCKARLRIYISCSKHVKMPMEIELHKTSFNAVVLMAAEKLLLTSANEIEGLVFHTDKPAADSDHDESAGLLPGETYSCPSSDDVLASPRDGLADFLGNPKVMLLTGKQVDHGDETGAKPWWCFWHLLADIIPGLLGQKLDPQRLRRLAEPATISGDHAMHPDNALRLKTLWDLIERVAHALPSDQLSNAFGKRPVDMLTINVEVQLTDEALHATARQRRNACLLTCVFAAVYTHYSVNEHDNALVYRMKRSVQDVVCGPAMPTHSALTASQSAVPNDQHSVMSSVRDASDFFPWLEGAFTSSVYASHFQLSGSNSSSPDALWQRGYILDGTAMIVGGVRVSQIRSKRKRQYCSRVGLQLLGDTTPGGDVAGLGCSAAMHTHDSGWSFDGASEHTTTFVATHGRVYNYAPIASHVGASALGLRYPSPGFFFELPQGDGDVARAQLKQHRGNASHPGFVDRQTRALFVDMSVYSLTLDHMCHVRVMVDVPVSGGAFPRCAATPIWLANLARPWNQTSGRVAEWIIVVIMFVWLFTRVILAFNKHLSRYRFSFPTWPHTKATLQDLHNKHHWAQNTQSMADALSARKAAHKVVKIARRAVEKARTARATAGSSRRTPDSPRGAIVTPLSEDAEVMPRCASADDVSRQLKASHSFDSNPTTTHLPRLAMDLRRTATAAQLRHSMTTPTREEALSQSIHTTKDNISANDERFRFQIERFASDMQTASKYWRSMFMWPLFVVVMIAFWVQAEVYRGWAADTAPDVNATIAARDRYVDFSVSGFWLETSTTLTGVNIFLAWIFVARLAHRFVLAQSVCPPSTKSIMTKVLAKDKHMQRVPPGISTGLKLVIYTASAFLVLIGFVCTNVIVYGAHVEAFRSFYPALLAVLLFKRPDELGEVDSASLLGPLILLAWVILIVVLLNFLLSHVLDVAAEVYDPVRAKTNSIYDGFQHFTDRIDWVKNKVKDVQNLCADFPKLAKAAHHRSAGPWAATGLGGKLGRIASGKIASERLDRLGKTFDKLASNLYKIEQMRDMVEDARTGKLSADDFTRRARRHLQSSESVLPVALLSVVSGNAAVLLKHLVHASGRGAGGSAPDDSAGGSRANGDTEDEMKDSCEVDSRSDAADSSDSVPGDVGASSTAGRRLVSQAAQEALDGMHIEEVAEQHFKRAIEDGIGDATAASFVERVSEVCEAVGNKINSADDFRSQVEQLQAGQLSIDVFLRSMQQRLRGDILSTLVPVVGAALPGPQRHRAKSIVDTVGKIATEQVKSLHRGSGRAGNAVRACVQAAHDAVIETTAATEPAAVPTSAAAPAAAPCSVTVTLEADSDSAFHRMLGRVARTT